MTDRLFRSIESESNGVFKQLVKLLTPRGIRKHGATLVAGTKIVHDLLGSSPEIVDAWVSAEGQPPPPASLPPAAAWYQLSRALFRRIDELGTEAPLLLIRVPPLPEWQAGEGLAGGCNLFVPFQDPENVGTVIRSAVAFGVPAIILLSECAQPFHPKSVRASGGAVFTAPLRAGPALADLANRADLPGRVPLVALSPEGRDIAGFDFPPSFGLLPGTEGPGLPAALRVDAVSIPMVGAVESLNSATATAIAMYVWRASLAR